MNECTNSNMITSLLGTRATTPKDVDNATEPQKTGRVVALWTQYQGYLMAMLVFDDGTADTYEAHALTYSGVL